VVRYPARASEISKIGKDFIDKYSSKFGLIYEFNTLQKISTQRILFVGLQKRTEFNQEKARIITGKIIHHLKEFDIREFSIIAFDSSEEIIEAITDGIILSTYSFNKYKTKSEKNVLRKVTIICDSKIKQFQKIIDKTCIISETINFARDISNLPPNECSPEYLARLAMDMNKEGVKTTIIDFNEMKSFRLNGIISVGKGSNNEPKFIILKYTGTKSSEKPVLLVGKAVTFDSGGVSIKPSERMDEMKFDKCGGVNVISIIKALSLLKPSINVIGIIPAVENMPSGYSYRPGDIIEMYNGKKVEVLNTDAEGRLILADALSYGISTFKPKFVIDMATLTGACIIALGSNVAGIMSNNSELVKKIISISDRTSEKMWELPLFDEFHEQIKSNYADIKNIGGRAGGAITAAAFLSNFVENTPWVHIDIAGTAWSQDGTNSKSYNPTGATGFGVKTIIKLLLSELK
jgi:leucyl aminopeptidase